jgi:hypothetical protein
MYNLFTLGVFDLSQGVVSTCQIGKQLLGYRDVIYCTHLKPNALRHFYVFSC